MLYGYGKILFNHNDIQYQEELLLDQGILRENIFICRENTIKAKNELLKKVINKMSRGDTLIVWKIHCLATSLNSFIKDFYSLNQKGVSVKCLENIYIDTTNSTYSEFIVPFVKLMNELNKANIREKTVDGINKARERGVQLGRKKGLSFTAKKKAKLAALYYRSSENYTITEILDKTEIGSKATLFRYLDYMGRRKCDICQEYFWKTDKASKETLCKDHYEN